MSGCGCQASFGSAIQWRPACFQGPGPLNQSYNSLTWSSPHRNGRPLNPPQSAAPQAVYTPRHFYWIVGIWWGYPAVSYGPGWQIYQQSHWAALYIGPVPESGYAQESSAPRGAPLLPAYSTGVWRCVWEGCVVRGWWPWWAVAPRRPRWVWAQGEAWWRAWRNAGGPPRAASWQSNEGSTLLGARLGHRHSQRCLQHWLKGKKIRDKWNPDIIF